MSEEKTEKPTPKRRKEARKEGQVARTQELGGWASLLVVAMLAPTLIGHEMDSVRTLLVASLTSPEHPSQAHALGMLGSAAKHVFLALVIIGMIERIAR